MNSKSTETSLVSVLLFVFMVDPAQGPVQHTAHKTRIMPDTAIQPVTQRSSCAGFAPAAKCCYNSDDLIRPDIRLVRILMIAPEGVGLTYLYNSVEHIVTVISAIQSNVILFQPSGDR